MKARMLVMLGALVAAACGGDDDGGADPIDASTVDAPLVAANVLGQTCTPGTDECPSGTCVILGSGSDTSGYCSPMCSMDPECTTGYTGPATGTPVCFNPTVPGTCTITCNLVADCPTGLDCVRPGGPMAPAVCVFPE